MNHDVHTKRVYEGHTVFQSKFVHEFDGSASCANATAPMKGGKRTGGGVAHIQRDKAAGGIEFSFVILSHGAFSVVFDAGGVAAAGDANSTDYMTTSQQLSSFTRPLVA
jgi:hypothetical protein